MSKITMKKKNFIFAFDFDGTVVTHEYPVIGQTLPLAIPTLLELQKNGYQLMLYTMCSDEELQDAVNYLNNQGLNDFWINENPEQFTWTRSKKQYANIYIDDAALGCPLMKKKNIVREFVDWEAVLESLKAKGYIDQDSYNKVLGLQFIFIKYKDVTTCESFDLVHKYYCPKNKKRAKFLSDIFDFRIDEDEIKIKIEDLLFENKDKLAGYRQVIYMDSGDGVDISERILGYIKMV